MPTPKLEMVTIEITGLAVNTIPPYRSQGDIGFLKLLSSYPVHRLVRTSDGQGGWSESYAYSHSIMGRIRPASAFERANADKEQGLVSHVLMVPHETDLKRGDKVIIGRQSIEVLTVTPTSSNHHLSANCEETQNGV
jgi:head-tail adaptor